MLKRVLPALITFLAAAALPAAGYAATLQDTVRVTGTRTGNAQDRQITVITAADLAASPVSTIGEALALCPSVDVQSRGLPGAQADITMRGGMFEQVLVLVDGVRMNSAQTGHLHADVPVALGMIDRIEIMPGQASSVYGTDAANGVINIITKKNADGFNASAGYGEYGSLNAGVSLGVESAGLEHTVCVERAQSDGYRYDTDFENTFVNFKSRKAYGAGTLEASVQFANREFGAFDFYTPGLGLPSKEFTRTTGTMLRNRHAVGKMMIESFIAAREQFDRFLPHEYDPLYYPNEHTTRYLEVESFASGPVGPHTRAVIGLNAGIDHLTSSKLSDRHGQHQALFGEIRHTVTDNSSLTSGVRIDRTDRNFNVSPKLAYSWHTACTGWYAQAGMAARTPSYTELYYVTGDNIGNAALVDERTAGMEIGARHALTGNLAVKMVMHVTRYDDYIDWAGTTAAGPWYSSNMGRMLVYGIEPELTVANRFVRAALRTSFLQRQMEETYISKYAFRYPEAAVTFTGSVPLVADRAELGVVTSYRKRTDEEGYLLADLRLRIDLPYGVAARCDVKNIFDTDYADIPGVPQPGRMLSVALEYQR